MHFRSSIYKLYFFKLLLKKFIFALNNKKGGTYNICQEEEDALEEIQWVVVTCMTVLDKLNKLYTGCCNINN